MSGQNLSLPGGEATACFVGLWVAKRRCQYFPKIYHLNQILEELNSSSEDQGQRRIPEIQTERDIRANEIGGSIVRRLFRKEITQEEAMEEFKKAGIPVDD